MPINTREKRQSAFSLLLPVLTPGVVPDAPGVDTAERHAAGFSYSGILAQSPLTPVVMIRVTPGSEQVAVPVLAGLTLSGSRLHGGMARRGRLHEEAVL
jgi:hypothetical protein